MGTIYFNGLLHAVRHISDWVPPSCYCSCGTLSQSCPEAVSLTWSRGSLALDPRDFDENVIPAQDAVVGLKTEVEFAQFDHSHSIPKGSRCVPGICPTEAGLDGQTDAIIAHFAVLGYAGGLSGGVTWVVLVLCAHSGEKRIGRISWGRRASHW